MKQIFLLLCERSAKFPFVSEAESVPGCTHAVVGSKGLVIFDAKVGRCTEIKPPCYNIIDGQISHKMSEIHILRCVLPITE